MCIVLDNRVKSIFIVTDNSQYLVHLLSALAARKTSFGFAFQFCSSYLVDDPCCPVDKICGNITALLPASVFRLSSANLLFHLILKIIGDRVRVANHVFLDIRYKARPRFSIDCGGVVVAEAVDRIFIEVATDWCTIFVF